MIELGMTTSKLMATPRDSFILLGNHSLTNLKFQLKIISILRN